MTKYFILYKQGENSYFIHSRELPTDDIEKAHNIISNEIRDREIDDFANDLVLGHGEDIDIENARDTAHDMIGGKWYRFSDIFKDVDNGVYNSIKKGWESGLFIINNKNKLWNRLGMYIQDTKKIEVMIQAVRKSKNRKAENHIYDILSDFADIVVDNIRKYYDV